MRILVFLALATCTLAAACGREPATTSETDAGDASWRLSAAPTLEIGLMTGEEAYQLADVVGAVRLSDGTIVVANDGTREIRFFGSDGRFLRAWGREGNGPEEVRRLYSLSATPGDTVVVVDGIRRRFIYLTSAAALARAEPWPEGEIFPGRDWLAWRTIVRSGLPRSSDGRVVAALQRMPGHDGAGYRFVRVARDGSIWTRRAGAGVAPSDSVTWSVHDLEGTPVATLTTPPGLVVHDSGPGWILGSWQDELGVQFIRLYDVQGVAATTESGAHSAAGDDAPRPGFTPVEVEGMAGRGSTMQTLAGLQEDFYANHGTYSASLDSLTVGRPALEVPDGFEVAILSAESTGWIGQAHDPAAGTTCVMNMLARGWLRLSTPPGFVQCWKVASTSPRPAS